MARPDRPSAPTIAGRSAFALTVDWLPAPAVSYFVKLQDSAGVSTELQAGPPPFTASNLFANERYSVTLLAENQDGRSDESDATIGWTALPVPGMAPSALATRDGTVSVGWDLTSELARVAHLDTLLIEVGRSVGAAPQIDIIGSGKGRAICFDLTAPVGPLTYRLRLRADHAEPEAPKFSDWGPIVSLVKAAPVGSSSGPTSTPGSGFVPSRSFALASYAAKSSEADEDEEGDTETEKSPKGGETKSEDADDGGGRAGIIIDPHGPGSRDDFVFNDNKSMPLRDASDVIPRDSDPVRGKIISSDLGIEFHHQTVSFETRETTQGDFVRQVEPGAHGWEAIGGWQRVDPTHDSGMPSPEHAPAMHSPDAVPSRSIPSDPARQNQSSAEQGLPSETSPLRQSAAELTRPESPLKSPAGAGSPRANAPIAPGNIRKDAQSPVPARSSGAVQALMGWMLARLGISHNPGTEPAKSPTSGVSRTGLAFLKLKEGNGRKGHPFEPYVDVAGKLTVGYGHLVKKNEKFPGKITEAEAEALLINDLASSERAVRNLVKAPLTQGQYDALVSFTFNFGGGALKGSQLLKKLNAKDYAGAKREFLKWDKITDPKTKQKRAIAGQTRRRREESEMFDDSEPRAP